MQNAFLEVWCIVGAFPQFTPRLVANPVDTSCAKFRPPSFSGRIFAHIVGTPGYHQKIRILGQKTSHRNFLHKVNFSAVWQRIRGLLTTRITNIQLVLSVLHPITCFSLFDGGAENANFASPPFPLWCSSRALTWHTQYTYCIHTICTVYTPPASIVPKASTWLFEPGALPILFARNRGVVYTPSVVRTPLGVFPGPDPRPLSPLSHGHLPKPRYIMLVTVKVTLQY